MAKGVKNKKVEQTEAQAVLASVKDLELTKVVNDIGYLQVSLQSTLANLSATITSKLQQVEQLDTAISLKEQRLQELFDIEKEAVTLDDMKAQKEEEARKWERESQLREEQWEEEEQEYAKSQRRTEEEYNYRVEQERKKLKDEFEADLAKRHREEQLRTEQLNRNWADREDKLKSQEQEVADLKTQVAGFEQRVKSEVAKAEAVLTNSLKRHYEHETALLQKDAEAERNLNRAKVSAMNDQMTKLEKQIENLQRQLEVARADAKEVATQALQSASGRQVADALQSVVHTSRTNDVPSKSK